MVDRNRRMFCDNSQNSNFFEFYKTPSLNKNVCTLDDDCCYTPMESILAGHHVMDRKRVRKLSSMTSSPSSSPMQCEEQVLSLETSRKSYIMGATHYSKNDRAPNNICPVIRPNIVLSDGIFSDPSWDDTEDFEADFDAVDIKWVHTDSVINAQVFQKDIYSRWRLSEQATGLSPYFINCQKRGVTEVVRKNTLINILLERKNINITQETLHLAIYVFDKCLDTFQVDNSVIKDIAAISLVLASKYEEYRPLKFSNVVSLELTNSNNPLFLGNLEKRIFYEMGYNLAFSTSFMFLNYFHSCLKSSLHVVQMASYILELSLLSTKYRDFGGAFTAHAAICLSCGVIIGTLQDYSAMIVIEEAEIDLFESSGIQAGSTRQIMWHLSAREGNAVWIEYCRTERCGVAKHKVPNDIIAQLQDLEHT